VYAVCAAVITRDQNVPTAHKFAPGCEADPENQHPSRDAGVFSL
jgi:hypothetical protein